MKKKDYRAVTYGLAYKAYRPMLNKKIYETCNCKGYRDFLSDINLLKKNLYNKGMPSIIAEYWLRDICNMSKQDLIKYVENYKKGKLDPFKNEPSLDKFDDEIEEEII